MTIQSTSAAPRSAPPANNAPPPQTPPPADEDLGGKIVDKLVSSPAFNERVLKKMAKGEEVTIEVNGAPVVKIKAEGPGIMQRFIQGTKDFISYGAEEVSGIIQADPAFAFKEAALGVKSQVYNGLPSNVQEIAEVAFLPMLRIVALALDVKKFFDTRNKLAAGEATRLDKFVDGAHIATDVAGVVGAVAFHVPSITPLAMPLTAVGLAGDIAAYSYHVLQYLRERGAVGAREGEAKEHKPPAPAPTPAPAASQSPLFQAARSAA
jgi:hypothetical protein